MTTRLHRSPKITKAQIADQRVVYYADNLLHLLPNRDDASWYTYKGQLFPLAQDIGDPGEATYFLERANATANVAPTLPEVQSVYSTVTAFDEGDNFAVKLSDGTIEWWDVLLGAVTFRINDTSASGNAQYTHTQAVAATTWSVNHNLGSMSIDSVNIYVGGQKVYAPVVIVDANNLSITFSLAQSGYAIIEV